MINTYDIWFFPSLLNANNQFLFSPTLRNANFYIFFLYEVLDNNDVICSIYNPGFFLTKVGSIMQVDEVSRTSMCYLKCNKK